MNKEEKRIYNKQYHQKHRKELLFRRRQYYQEHKSTTLAYQRQHYIKNKEKIEIRVKNYLVELKTEILAHYGGGKVACVRCGFNDIRALSIDHIGRRKGDKQHFGGASFYRELKTKNYPEGYQTLCMNCQFIKRVENKEYSKRRVNDG